MLGAVVTILPLGVLPFAPEPPLRHYFAHAVYTACELPLLAASNSGLSVHQRLRQNVADERNDRPPDLLSQQQGPADACRR